ncbi:hypothetical protein QMM42_09475 [Leptospira santarosai]|uniref:hypothetical protein n=1 Tax=Leptospira santarosai TaxID=28183 RepID=UPI00030D81F5|nr:hypothetical protein [Leptospira santarosai]MDI7186430.1 hypothetical protein [Leptospira santarosai]MDI7205324.1 hypothetical protein [Leptospira santarosai]MDI7210760.1 hypothetical protein [Leptospira santarosai]
MAKILLNLFQNKKIAYQSSKQRKDFGTNFLPKVSMVRCEIVICMKIGLKILKKPTLVED